MKRICPILALAASVILAAAIHAQDQKPSQVKYAAVLYDPASGFSAETEVAENLTYILTDPMVGDFTLDVVDISAPEGEPSGVAKARDALRGRASGADIGLYYLRRAPGDRLDLDSDDGKEFLSGLPGKAAILIEDLTALGQADEKAAVAFETRETAAGRVLVARFSGPVAQAESPAAVAFEALRGNADSDRNRKVTFEEFVAFISARATASAPASLGGLAAAPLVSYRSPAQLAKEFGPDKSLAVAGRYLDQQRWVEALLMLREIKDASVTDPEYKRVSESAQLNLAIAARYSTESRTENVERDQEAGLSLVSDVVLLANLHYVKDVDNRALFAGGVKNLQLILDNRRVRKNLIPPDAAGSAGEFAAFLKETLDYVYERETLSEDDFLMRIKRIIMESDATVKLPAGVIVTEFIYGVPAALDPNTDFIPKLAYKEFQDETKGHFGGIGVEITLEDKILTIVTPLEGTPGAEAGLLPGDRITAIEGQSTESMDLFEAVTRLRGPVGTKVTISVVHRGDTTPTDYTIKRGEITMNSTRGYAVDEATGQWNYFADPALKIAYVRVTDFKETTPDELDGVLSKIADEGMKGLVLDLRFNHGGLLTSGVDVADAFLKSGAIVKIEGAHCRATTYKAHYFKTQKDFPVVLLVNGQSASAAEIVAGALQDHKRATLVGERTFGKGTVQTVFELEHGQSALKLTTAKYYTPAGSSIHRDPYSDVGGLKPDYEVPMSDEESGMLIDVWHLRGLRKEARERLIDKDKQLAAKDPELKVPDPDSFNDPQLDKALDLIRASQATERAGVEAPADANAESAKL
jgi:carboxyl-terminal processing protease